MVHKLRIFVLLGLLVAIVPIARGLVRPPAAIAEPRYEAEWETVVASQFEEIGKGGYELVFIGDSIMEQWSHQGREVWEAYYGDREALNLGVGGDRTENVLWRIDHAGLDRISPKVAVLLIGTNNYQVSDAYGIGEGTLTIVQRLEKVWPQAQILVVGILPSGEWPNPHRDVMEAANHRTKSLIHGRNVHYLDVRHALVKRHGRTRADTMIDFLHLAPKGYEAWAKAMETTLARLLGDAPKDADHMKFRPLVEVQTVPSPQSA